MAVRAGDGERQRARRASPGGTVTVSRDARAALTRAGTSPMRTSGRAGPEVSKPSPMTVRRPPSVAAEGVTLTDSEARWERVD